MNYKQAIILRKDLALSKGKAVAQACHASLNSLNRASDEVIQAWDAEGAKKVVLEVPDEPALLKIFEDAKTMGLPVALIMDAGLTEIPSGTKTSVGIGPAKEEDINKLTGALPLVK